MGEMLKVAEKNTGGNLATLKNVSTGSKREPVDGHRCFTCPACGRDYTTPPGHICKKAPTLADQGISKKQSSTAQALATVKERKPELYEQVKAGKVTVAAARVELKRGLSRFQLDRFFANKLRACLTKASGNTSSVPRPDESSWNSFQTASG